MLWELLVPQGLFLLSSIQDRADDVAQFCESLTGENRFLSLDSSHPPKSF